MLAILTPVFKQVEPDFLVSLHKTMQGGGVSWFHCVGHANLSRARNYLVQQARDAGAEQIIFIDADIGWEPGDIGHLFDCAADVRVVAGAPQRRDDKLGFCGGIDRDNTKHSGRLISGTAATAFLRVDVSVFADLESQVETYAYQGKEYHAFFQTVISGGEMLDEDVFFSRLCKDNGIDVWIDPTIRLRHWHSQPLTGCIADHITKA